jgi:hypothetical protein
MPTESKKFWLDEASEKLLAYAEALITPEWVKANDGPNLSDGSTIRLAATALQWAAFEAIRREWYGMVARAGLQVELEVAKQMMHEEHYRIEISNFEKYPNADKIDPIVGQPGRQAMIMKVDGKDAVAYEYNMAGLMPLSAYYTDKVRESIDTAALVGARMEAARKKLEEVKEVEVVVEAEYGEA